MALWLLPWLMTAAAPDAPVVVRPAWRPGQVLTYTLTRTDSRVEGDATLPAAGRLTRRFELRVVGPAPEGGITAELHGLQGDRAVTARFDADGALTGITGGAVDRAAEEALHVAFLPGYKRPLDTGGTWAAILERGEGDRYLVDVALRLERVAAGPQGREARVHAAFTFAGAADPLPWKAPLDAAPGNELYADGLTGTGEIVFDLDLGVVRRAAHEWRTSFARRGSDGPGPDYEVMAGALRTAVTLELVAVAAGNN
jgi:hypothetical protein